jgi:hypothetical protein
MECKFWLEDDGWNGTSDHPLVRVRAASFEQAKMDIEYALGKYIEQLLREESERKAFAVGLRAVNVEFLRHVLQYLSHFAVHPLMLLPCSVAGIHFLFPWLFIVQSGVSQFEPTRLLLP